MPVFQYTFTVAAPIEVVAQFHHDTRALKLLTPPPVFVQLHRVDPLAERSISHFTLWFGPLPVEWIAMHSNVDPIHGFMDTQIRGLMESWQHTHHFSALDERRTRVDERIEYEYPAGLRGMLARLLFSPVLLRGMFAYRAWVTRRQTVVRREQETGTPAGLWR